MSQPELLRKVVRTLDELGIEHMVTGSVASSLQGEPRSTHDIDIVIAVDRARAEDLVKAFPSPGFYLDEHSVLDAIGKQDTFNLLDVNSGDKVDFWVLTDEPFDRSRFARRYAEEVAGTRINVSCAEDTILAKLRWAKLSGGSEKQFTDALRVYEVQFRNLDIEYLRSWAAKLSVDSMLRRLEKEAETV